jgi:hypothetical protein
MILSEDYKFRDDIKADTVPIELLTEAYKGVILRFTTVAVREMEHGQAKLQFQYDLLEMGDHTETSLRKDPKFENHVGLILNAMILESVEAPDDNREDDLKESD